MKKKLLFLSVTVFTLATAVFVWSCSKDDASKQPKPEVKLKSEATAKSIKLPSNGTKDTYTAYALSSPMGHLASHCGSRCMSYKEVRYHEDCVLYGNICTAHTIVIIGGGWEGNERFLGKKSNASTFTITEVYQNSLTDTTVFGFPARSFRIADAAEANPNKWLNVPEQIVERNAETKLFTFTGVYYSETPEFTNE